MDEAKNNNSPARYREFDAQFERISDQSKCDGVAKAGFVADGHVHFKGEGPNPRKDPPPVEASSVAQGGHEKAGELLG